MPKKQGQKPNDQSNDQFTGQPKGHSTDQIIDGDAVEKDAQKPAGSRKTSPNKDNERKKPSFRAKAMTTGLIMAGMILGALIAAGGAGSYYAYTQRMATPQPAAPSPSDGRITALEAQIASLTAAHEQLTARMNAAQDASVSGVSGVAGVAGLSQILRDLTDRIEKAEQLATQTDNQNASAVQNNTRLDAGNLPQTDMDLLLAQTSVTVMSAVVSDNAAGRGLAHWVPVMDALLSQTSPQLDQQWSALRGLFLQTPPSQSLLLAEGHRFVMPMIDNTYDDAAAQDDTIFGQAVASLGKLVQLRPVDQNRAGATGHLAKFEAALAASDLRRATGLADNWPGASIDGLDQWRQAARARLDLDNALAAALAQSLTRFDARLQNISGVDG